MKLSLPIDLGTGLEPTGTSIAEYYKHNELDNKGGYFPIGGNTVWHGGIHLKPDQDVEIFAPFPGKIIAAHLPHDSSKAIGNYGSANFILLEHEYKSNKFFSLYMHLKNLPLKADNEYIKKIKWLGEGESLKGTLDKLSTGKILKCNVSVKAGDPLWITGEYGSSRYRSKLLHWEIFAEKNVFETPRLPDTPTSLAGATGWTATKSLLVKKVHPAPPNVYITDKVLFRVSELNYKDAPASECSKIKWQVKSTDGSFNQTFENKGISLEFTVPEILAGKTINVFPYVNSSNDALFAKTEVQSGKRPETFTIEDSDNNYNADNETILKMFPVEMLGTDNLLTTDELIKFYKENPSGNAVKMRYAQCKFVAEWGIPDINTAIKTLKNKGWFLSANDVQPYVWWKDAVDAGVSLPADPHVWHFHPVKVVENFMAEGGAESGTNENADISFYVKRNGVEVVVENISDILDNEYKHTEGRAIISAKAIYYKENSVEKELGKPMKYGSFKGLFATGSPDLKSVFVDNTNPDLVPDGMTPEEKRIWASIWHSEAGLDGLNSYDSAYLSVGGIQKTMGVVGSKGELQGTFAYIKSKNPTVFNQYLGNFGFDIVECDNVNANVPTAHCKVGAVVLKTAETKQNELSKFIWAYRSRKALNDPVFQKLYLESSIKRLTEIKGWKTFKYDGYDVKIGDVFKTELALAILIDSHVNSPKYMKVIATKAIREVGSVFEKIKNGTTDTITLAEEKSLIKELITYRRTNAPVSVTADPDTPDGKTKYTAPMTDPKLRTAFIAMCVENIQTDTTLLTDIGYSTVNQIREDAGILISNNSYFYNFLKVERS